MTTENEHTAILTDTPCTNHRTHRITDSIKLILCQRPDGQLISHSYKFKAQKHTPRDVDEWLDKLGVKAMKITPAKINAKLHVKAEKNSTGGVDGRFWSKGIHHVYVDDKPSRVYVPEETLLETFQKTRKRLNTTGLRLGVDHLPPQLLEENKILAKMDLLDVGRVNRIGMDGDSLYILESELRDPKLLELHQKGELPAYSVVGNMTAEPCPTDQADYVLKSLDIERIDFVEEGGCQECTVGAEPDMLVLTSKKHKEDKFMSKNEAKPTETMEADAEDVVVEDAEKVEDIVKSEDETKPVVDSPESENDEALVAETKQEPVETPDDDDVGGEGDEIKSIIKTLQDEIKSLKKELGSKKPVKAKDSSAEEEVSQLIKDGRALPKMKAGLLRVAAKDPQAFKELKESLPVMVQMTAKAKLAQLEEKDKKEANALEGPAYFESDEYKEKLRRFGL